MTNVLHDVIGQPRLRQFRRTWGLVWHSAPLWTALNGLLVLVEGLLPLVSLYLLKLIVDAFAGGLAGEPSAYRTAAWRIAALAGVSALGAICKACNGLVVQAHGQAVTDHVQSILQAKAVEVDLEDYESPDYHDLLQQVQSQATFRPARISRGVFTTARSTVSVLALGALLFSFAWQVGLVLIVCALPGIVVRLRYAHQLLDWYGRQSSRQRFASYMHALLVGTAHAKEVRLFGLGGVLRERARRLRATLRTERLQLERRRTLLELVPGLSSVFALFASFVFVVYRARLGEVTLGDIVMYYQAFQRCQSSLSELLASLVGLYEDSLFLGILYRFLDLRPKVLAPVAPRPVPRPLREGLTLENVTFRYPRMERDVLSGISLSVRPGEVLALVGENGAGKSTLIKLVCRLYDPLQGRILLDGADIREFAVPEYRRAIGVVFQDFNHYNLTARENIWFGDVETPEDDARIREAAIKAGAHDTIAGLARGYDTVLGREFRSGEQLSAGQWQRVAVARALLRDSQIMILDEPTSAMDPKAEHEMYRTFREMTAGRTTLLISHRLSTVAMADRICVLDRGRIVEIGTHSELCHRRGIYADLFERQGQAYR